MYLEFVIGIDKLCRHNTKSISIVKLVNAENNRLFKCSSYFFGINKQETIAAEIIEI